MHRSSLPKNRVEKQNEGVTIDATAFPDSCPKKRIAALLTAGRICGTWQRCSVGVFVVRSTLPKIVKLERNYDTKQKCQPMRQPINSTVM